MQINTSKYISLIVLLLIPIFLSAQIGRKKYITRSGDTTVVVMTGVTGLSGGDAEFLFDARISKAKDNIESKYTRLVDAAKETDVVAEVLEKEQIQPDKNAGSLGFRAAQQNLKYLQNEKRAKANATDNINKDASLEELTFLYEKFGNKPSYFINGVPVDYRMAASVSDGDILTRSVKVTNTSTGNPNGEIWYVVKQRTFDRLKLDEADVADGYDVDISRTYGQTPKDNSYASEDWYNRPAKVNNSNKKPSLSEQEKELEELRRMVRDFGIDPSQVSRTASPTNNAYTAPKGNARRGGDNNIVSFKDSPAERARRARDINRRDDINEVDYEIREPIIQVSPTDPSITTATPKRSVRRINDRQRNRD